MPIYAITKDGIPCSFLELSMGSATQPRDVLSFTKKVAERLLGDRTMPLNSEFLEIKERLQKRLLNAHISKTQDGTCFLGLPDSNYEGTLWEERSLNDLIECGVSANDLKSMVAGCDYACTIALEKYITCTSSG